MPVMSIGEVGRKSGLRPSAIRYYEKLGLLPEPPRVGGRRRYGNQALERLAIVRFARYVGFGVMEIRRLLQGFEGRPPPKRWREMTKARMSQVDALIAQAETIRGLLQDTLRHECPKLVERGQALLNEETNRPTS
jgi:MerR family redox-sensitive transcriptional activator SoxR